MTIVSDHWTKYDAPTIPGYTPNQATVPAVEVKDGQKDQTIDIVYTANDQSTTIKYVDENGQTVATGTLTGKTDQTVSVTIQIPDGYYGPVNKVPKTYKFGPDNNKPVIVEVITKRSATGAPVTNPDDQALIIVHYVDENGHVIAEDSKVGKIGETLTIDKHIPDGYYTDDMSPIIHQVTGDDGIIVVKVFKIKKTSDDGTNPEKTGNERHDDVNPSKNTDHNQSAETKQSAQQAKELPQTGNEDNLAVMGLGAASLLGMFGLADLNKKRH